MAECGASDHVLERPPEESPGSETVTVMCERCGVGSTMRFQVEDGKRILADVTMFPARGMVTMSTEMKLFFMANWEQACSDLENDGYVVVRGTPQIPPAPEAPKTGWAAVPLAGKIGIGVVVAAIIGIVAPIAIAVIGGLLLIGAVIWGLMSMLG
jgi:hypothetical protein